MTITELCEIVTDGLATLESTPLMQGLTPEVKEARRARYNARTALLKTYIMVHRLHLKR